MDEYGFKLQEIKLIVKHKPSFFLFKEDFEKNKKGILAVYNVLNVLNKIEKSQIKSLIVRYPPILSKSEDEINQFFSTLAKYYINKKDAFNLLNKCPKIISYDLE